MYNVIKGIKESVQSLGLTGAAVGLLGVVGCSLDESKSPSQPEACVPRDSYNLSVVIADYGTGRPVNEAIVRARWGEQREGIVCSNKTDSGEAGTYSCPGVPSDVSLEITVDGQTETYYDPVEACGLGDQTKTYLFGASNGQGGEDAGSDTRDTSYDHGHVDAVSDARDAGHDAVTEPVEEVGHVDVGYDARDAALEVSDLAADPRADAADLSDLADVPADTGTDAADSSDPVLETDVSDAYDALADTGADAADLSDPVLDSDASDAYDAIETDVAADTGADAGSPAGPCPDLSVVPVCLGAGYIVLVPTAWVASEARELGFQNVTTNPAVLDDPAFRGIVAGNPCTLPEYFPHEGDCTESLVPGQAVIRPALRGVDVEAAGSLEAVVALGKIAAEELSGSECTTTGTDPATADLVCNDE